MMAWRHAALAVAVLAVAIGVFTRPPILQDPAYHAFADQRVWLGVPNGGDVLSNVPFAIVGLAGLVVTFRRRPLEKWPYAALFAGATLTAFGSAYYHWAPDDARLVWDRLPITLGFMGLPAAVVGERVSLILSRWLLIPFMMIGGGSVAYWFWAGDLRPYVLVQFGSLLVVVLLLVLYRARYSGSAFFFVGVGAYAAAKVFETADKEIFALGQIVSGHTLKHLAAAGGIACLVAMLRVRRPIAPDRPAAQVP
jgi:hypothetical protein